MKSHLLDQCLNPIFKREFLGKLREPMMLGILGCYLFVPFIAIAFSWPSNQIYYGGGYQANNIFESFFICQFWLTFFLVPILGAFSISSEKENRTYEFLFTTLMPPWSIGISKLSAVLGLGILLLICSMPVLSFVFFLGGVDASSLIAASIMIVSASVILAEVALVWSAVFKKGYVALIATYLTPVLIMLLGSICANPLEQLLSQKGDLLKLIDALEAYLARLPGVWILTVICVASALMSSAILLPIIIRLTRRPSEERARPFQKPIESPDLLKHRRQNWPYYLIDPAKRPDPIADGANPLFIKEQLSNPIFNSAWRWRSVYITVLVMLLMIPICFGSNNYYEGTLLVWSIAILIILVWTALIHAIAFAGEHEARTIETLKLTNLTSTEFLRSKWILCFHLRWPLTIVAISLSIFITFLFYSYSGHDFYYRALGTRPFSFAPKAWILTILGFILLPEVTAITTIRLAFKVKTVRHTLILTLVTVAGLIILPFLSSYFLLYLNYIYQDHWISYMFEGKSTSWTRSSTIKQFSSLSFLMGVVFLIIWARLCIPGIFRQIHHLWKNDE